MRRMSDAVHAFLKSRLFYPLVFLACAWPLAHLVWNALPVLLPLALPDVHLPWTGGLGADPTQTMLNATGRSALRLLLITLTVTPVRRLTGWNRVQIVRRTLGLWSFAYAVTHLTVYVVFDQVGDFDGILDDVVNRKFIFVGMFTFAILLALAVTSTNGMMRRLGRRWVTLHRLIYVAGITGVVHFAWAQKADIHEPLEWGAYLAILLGFRVAVARRKGRQTGAAAVSP